MKSAINFWKTEPGGACIGTWGMNREQKVRLSELAGNRISFDRPMAPYTTFRVGGRIEALYEADNLGRLGRVVSYVDQQRIPYLVLGRGSNILVRDNGFDGLIIMLKGGLASVGHKGQHDPVVTAGAGLGLADLLTYCSRRALGGLEWAAGIPGTVGGAVMMNAGAFGHSFGTSVKEVLIMSPKGGLELRGRSELRFSYRRFELGKGELIVQAVLELVPDPENVGVQKIADYLKKRRLIQPLDYPSAGSVFKNPANDFAGRLIEEVGLKGKKLGRAMISDKHANFIVNLGGATAKDILELIHLAKSRVKREKGIDLELEIQVIGN